MSKLQLTDVNENRTSKEKKLEECRVDPKKIANLLGIVNRNLSDANVDAITLPTRYVIAYEAALQLASIVLHASGYRLTNTESHHEGTFQLVVKFMGEEQKVRANYFNSCRVRRNLIQYVQTIEITPDELKELIKQVKLFKSDVEKWLER